MDLPLRFADQLKQHLRALRLARKLTQAQLARKLGVGQSRVAEIESDPGLVSVEQLFRILTALDVQLVLRDTGGITAPNGAPRTKRAAKRRRMISGDDSW